MSGEVRSEHRQNNRLRAEIDRLKATTWTVPPSAVTVTEYAIVADVEHGVVVLCGPNSRPEWNETITLAEAAERWYPGGVVMSRTVTTFEPVTTDWQPVNTPAPDGPS